MVRYGGIRKTRLLIAMPSQIQTAFSIRTVVPFEDGFAGVFRCDSRFVSMDIFSGSNL